MPHSTLYQHDIYIQHGIMDSQRDRHGDVKKYGEGKCVDCAPDVTEANDVCMVLESIHFISFHFKCLPLIGGIDKEH